MLQVMQRLVHNLNKNPTMVSVSIFKARYRHIQVEVTAYGPFVRIECTDKFTDADGLICKVAADLVEENPNYKHSPLQIHDGSSGHREGLITFYENDGMII